jgi:hypothetical protein
MKTGPWNDFVESISQCTSCPAGEYYPGCERERNLQALASELDGREQEIRVLVLAESPPKVRIKHGEEEYKYYYRTNREERSKKSQLWKALNWAFENWRGEHNAILKHDGKTHDDVAVVTDCAQCAVNMWRGRNFDVRRWCVKTCLSLHLREMIEALELENLQEVLIAMPKMTWFEDSFEMYEPIKYPKKRKMYPDLVSVAESIESMGFRKHVFVSSVFGKKTWKT